MSSIIEDSYPKNWDEKYEYVKVDFTPIQKAIGYYICSITGVHPMRPRLRIADNRYYREWQAVIAYGGATDFTKHFAKSNFKLVSCDGD